MLGYVVAASLGYIGLEACLKFGKKPDSDIKNLNQFFKTVGFCSKGDKPEYAYVQNVEDFGYYKVFKIKIPIGHDVNTLFKLKYALENLFENDVEILHANQNYRIKVFKKKLGNVKDYPFRVVKVPDKNRFYIVLGMSLSGEMIIDLTQTPQIILGATTGGGKSTLVKQILCQSMENYSPEELNLIYMDNKEGLESQFFEDVKHLKKKTENVFETVDTLVELKQEMVRRMRLLREKKVTSIGDYNKKVSKNERLPFILGIVDELYCFKEELPKQSKNPNDIYLLTNVYNLIGTIVSTGRACGVHIMFCTQRPTSDVIPTSITNNCGVRIGLRTSTQQESRNIIEKDGLELLDPSSPCSGIVKIGDYTQFQGFYFTDDDVRKICEKHRKPIEETIKIPILKESKEQEAPIQEEVQEVKKEVNDLDLKSISRGM